jgi:hypothetical protein
MQLRHGSPELLPIRIEAGANLRINGTMTVGSRTKSSCDAIRLVSGETGAAALKSVHAAGMSDLLPSGQNEYELQCGWACALDAAVRATVRGRDDARSSLNIGFGDKRVVRLIPRRKRAARWER